jgi:hypothetical protein
MVPIGFFVTSRTSPWCFMLNEWYASSYQLNQMDEEQKLPKSSIYPIDNLFILPIFIGRMIVTGGVSTGVCEWYDPRCSSTEGSGDGGWRFMKEMMPFSGRYHHSMIAIDDYTAYIIGGDLNSSEIDLGKGDQRNIWQLDSRGTTHQWIRQHIGDATPPTTTTSTTSRIMVPSLPVDRVTRPSLMYIDDTLIMIQSPLHTERFGSRPGPTAWYLPLYSTSGQDHGWIPFDVPSSLHKSGLAAVVA